jgi:hypothetical protein
MDSDLRFLNSSRAPTVDEAMISCPVEYALRSTEQNDVIFLGGSSCRCGIDPSCLGRLRGFNLGSHVGLAPDGIFATAKAYLLNHPAPKVVVLCLSPITFDFQADDQWAVSMTSHFLLNYGGQCGKAPPLGKSAEYFVRRGFAAILERNKPDLRDMPLTGQEGDTYRTFRTGFLNNRGFLPMAGDRRGEVRLVNPNLALKIGVEWDELIQRMAGECVARGARLIVRFSPISPEQNAARDFSPINEWIGRLHADPAIVPPQPALLVYDRPFMWDNVHLNRRGVEKFMPLVAKDIQSALAH